MHFLAIVAVTPEGRVAKFQDFETMPEAQAHVDAVIGDYPDAFAVANPTARPWGEWVINPSTRQLSFSPPDPRVDEEAPAIRAIRLLAEDAAPATRAAVLALLP